ncbi:MAG TPA: PilZ domain-containing protein [Planctomycetota bacterium]|nr:PilZ domain-containing protein [Planctomycetota bacterium]
MIAAQRDTGKVVLYQPTSEHLASARRAERHSLDVESAASVTELIEHLSAPGGGVVVLCGFSAEARAVAKSLRAQKGLKRVPVFAIVSDDEIDIRVLKAANDQQIELLPGSLPDGRRWQKLRDAYDTCRSGKRWLVKNLRAHFRLPLKAKAALISECETIDISEGGVGFMTNQTYHPGDRGRIDVRSLLGDMDENERGFPFEVASVKALKQGSYRYLVGARFVDLSDEARSRLKAALEVIEPTEDE